MTLNQYLHFPKGNGSYTVAENLSKNVRSINGLWVIGEESSGIYTNEDFPVFFSHPKTKGKRFSELSSSEYQDYQRRVAEAVTIAPSENAALVHHGFFLAKEISEKVPVFSYLHGTEMLALKEGVPEYVKKDFYDGIASSEKVLVMSELQKKMAEDLFAGYLKSDVGVIGGGVDTNIFRPYSNKDQVIENYKLDPNKKIVLFAGRLTYEKGLEDLIQAFSSSHFSKDKQLVIVGQGNYYRPLKEMASEKDIDVNFILNQPQSELAKLMSSADVFVLPSHYESFGLVCLEALACHTPVVASNVGILKELVNPPFGGEMFDRTNYQEKTIVGIQRAIDEVLSKDKTDFSSQFENIINNYSWLKISEKLESIINSTLQS